MRNNLQNNWKNIRRQGAVKFISKMTIFWGCGWGLLFTLFVSLVEPEAISGKFFLNLLYISVVSGIAIGSYIWFRFEGNFRKARGVTIVLPKPDDIHWHTGGFQLVYNLERNIGLGIECFGPPIDGTIPYMLSPDKDLLGLLVGGNRSNTSSLQVHIEEQHILETYPISWLTYGGTRFFSFKAREFVPIYSVLTQYIQTNQASQN